MRLLMHIIVIAVIVGIPAFEAARVDRDEANQCVLAKMDTCNKKGKIDFVKGGKKGLSTRDVYCSSMRELGKCVVSQLQSGNDPLCNSDELRRYQFVVMAQLQMDKLMATCKEDVNDKFKEEVMEQFLLVPEFKKFQEFLTLAFGENSAKNVDDCAKAAHEKCIEVLTGREEADQKNLCNGVTTFIQCYQDHKCTSNRLSVAFADLNKEMSTELINALKAHSMCEKKKEIVSLIIKAEFM